MRRLGTPGVPADALAGPLVAAFATARGREAESLAVELERILAPREYRALLRGVAAPEARSALRARPVAADLRRAGPRLQPFARTTLSPEALLYRGPGRARAKTLIVALSGLRGRLGLPTACLLQRLDARRYDVLLLADPARRDFRGGVRGLADSLPALAARLTALGYGRIVTIGNSVGALPAAQLAVLAGAERAIALGARPSEDPARLLRGHAVAPAFDPLCACLAHRGRDLRFVHAADHAVDRACAEALAAAAGGVSVAVAGIAAHGILDALWKAGRLRPALDALLEGPAQAPGSRTRLDLALPAVAVPSRWSRLLRRLARWALPRRRSRGRS